MLKIEKIFDGPVLRLSGRIDAEHLAELTAQMQNSVRPVALDLSEVKLVDVGAVRYLALSEAEGTELRNCPLFVREWIRRETASSQKHE